MKLKRILASAAAAAVALSTSAVSAFAAGPNGDDNFSVFGLYTAMTKDEAIANGVLEADGGEPDDWSTIPVKVTFDEILFDGEKVTPNGEGYVYWQGDEFKIEFVNIYNAEVNGGADGSTTVFTTVPNKSISVKFTISGMKSGLAGSTYVGGGLGTGDSAWSSTFFGNKADEANPDTTKFVMPQITGNGTYTATVSFTGEDVVAPGNDDSDSDSDSETPNDSSKTDSESKTDNSNSAATGATTGLALVGIALAGAAIAVSRKRK